MHWLDLAAGRDGSSGCCRGRLNMEVICANFIEFNDDHYYIRTGSQCQDTRLDGQSEPDLTCGYLMSSTGPRFQTVVWFQAVCTQDSKTVKRWPCCNSSL